LLLPVLSAAELLGRSGPDPRPASPQYSNARDLCARGDAFFRNAEFDRAERCYRDAVAIDSADARAHLGLGRLARLQFRRKTAHGSFATAFRLDPTDPEILLAYSEYASEASARDNLYRALSGSVPHEDDRIQQVRAKLRMDRAVGSRYTRLAGPYRSYRLKLSPFLPVNSTPYGVVLQTRINGSKTLRLVLDTGAKGIVLWGKAVRDLGLDPIIGSDIGGLGSGAHNSGTVALAGSVEIGDLRLENALVEVTGKSFVPGADGIIGTEVFQEFLLRLDFWSRTLELVPFQDYTPGECSSNPWIEHDAATGIPPASTPAYHVGHLLALNAAVDRRQTGLFVLDTGSAYNTVSPELLGGRRGVSSSLVRGAQGSLDTQIATSAIEFQVFGGPTLNDRNVLALDLTQMSQKEGAKITGLLGYSALSRLTLSLNYRDGVVQFEPHNRR
jgi:Aspartyl protease